MVGADQKTSKKTGHHGVAHETVEKRATELCWPQGLITQSLPYLPQAK
jgi:hypothetical protein